MLRLVLLLCLANLVVSAQPEIYQGGIVNAASFAISGLQNSAIAPGSIFTIFGRELATINEGSSVQEFPLPKAEGWRGTKVTVQPSGQSVIYAPLLYVSKEQIVAIMPSSVPTGKTVFLRVETSRGQSEPATLTLVQQSFGLFSSSASGAGPGAIQNFVSADSYPLNTLISPARPGQTVVLWGTGLGPIEDDDALPAKFGEILPRAEVFVGGRRVTTIEYQGRSPGSAGLDQINVVLPQDIITGCHVPVVVKTSGGVISNTVTMAISADGRPCSDPVSFYSEDIDKAQGTSKSVTLGAIKVKRVRSGDAVTDEGIGWFGTCGLTEMINSRGVFAAPSLGTCTVDQFRGQEYVPPDGLIPQTVFPNGDALKFTMGGVQRQLMLQSGMYKGQIGGGSLPPLLDPGTLRIENTYTSLPGQTPFHFNVEMDIPSGVTWTGDLPASISRTQDLTITWAGGDPNAEYVQIVGYSTLPGGGAGAGFVCSAPVSAGSFTIPALVLGALPAGAGKLQVGAVALPWKHRQPPPAANLNALYLSYTIAESSSLNWAP
ncbi:MAG: hypothetical protein ACM3S5_19180 [Rhodospirillales bacterium]